AHLLELRVSIHGKRVLTRIIFNLSQLFYFLGNLMLRKKRMLTIKLMAAQADSVYTRYIENGK
ncbi:TPA: hypothetical protein ACJUA0_002055, partial [Vibrio cholerae]